MRSAAVAVSMSPQARNSPRWFTREWRCLAVGPAQRWAHICTCRVGHRERLYPPIYGPISCPSAKQLLCYRCTWAALVLILNKKQIREETFSRKSPTVAPAVSEYWCDFSLLWDVPRFSCVGAAICHAIRADTCRFPSWLSHCGSWFTG